MRREEEFEWIRVEDSYPCTRCEEVNGDCIADTLPIVDKEGTEVTCPRGCYPVKKGSVTNERK